MIRKNQQLLNILNAVLDIGLLIAAYMLSAWLWLDVIRHNGNMAEVNGHTLWLSLLYALGTALLLAVLGFYNTTRTRRVRKKLALILAANSLSVTLAAALFYVFRLQEFSRGVALCFYAFSNLFLMAKYVLMRLIFGYVRARGLNLKHVVVLGTGHLALQYAQDIAAEKSLGMHLLGFIGNPGAGAEPYLGGFEEADRLLADPAVSEAVIALEVGEIGRIASVIGACERSGVKYFIIPFYNDIIPARPVIENIGRSKLMNIRANALENYAWAFFKRAFDVIASALGLMVLSPLLLLIAAGVKLSSPGPVLFRQERVGYRRKTFRMLKFRSMRVNDKQDTAWSTDADARKTRFGSLIRKCSLDELPQLINVLKGDMSLIGPRPELPYFVEKFKQTIPLYMVKHQVRPGITGWAQVNGYRGDTDIAKRIELDLWYIEHWSPLLDARILFKTFFGGMINHEKIQSGVDA